MFCSKCGHKIDEKNIFCHNCGEKIKKQNTSNELRYSYLYDNDLNIADWSKPKRCASGKHEFIAIVSHELSCVSTMPNIYFKCKKCNELYYGSLPKRYGVVVEEQISQTEEHF